MATYREIQDFVQARYGFIPKTCWIADVKSRAGLPMRKAWNRQGETRVIPCPEEKVLAIMDALRTFAMVK